ncbi:hypothetical protein SeMB42_g00675 [Synchytrium endobioticum]|uniref:TPX2 C-terminal domain-containing protein n=1 Tax=Synchytrium endobioticum TaxID=286115 RepID=A0A507DQ06_9FUNG|nr:hypothetical protein SeLEV6574_g00831 [Synchytrium endobioticum]TPX53576.1 hypothetical protein SeMB42_g00675 [Synchytrium endobioticum]
MGKRRSARVTKAAVSASILDCEETPKASQINARTEHHVENHKNTSNSEHQRDMTFLDSEFEFNAPQFHDFSNHNEDAEHEINVDGWFDKRLPTPKVSRRSSKRKSDAPVEAANDEVFGESRRSTRRMTRASTVAAKAPQYEHNLFQPVMAQQLTPDGQQPIIEEQPKQQSPLKSTVTQVAEMLAEEFEVQTVKPPSEFGSSTASNNTFESPSKKAARSMKPDLHKMKLRTRMPTLGAATAKAAIKKKAMAKRPGLTVPEPFHFHTTLKEHGNEVTAVTPPKSPFEPLAQKVKKFEAKTPERFKSKPVKPQPTKVQDHKLTHPKSPFLRSKLRARPKHIPSREELEAAEMASIQPFKAKPVDPRIVNGSVKSSAPKKNPLTVPKSPPITKPKGPAPPAPPPPRVVKATPLPDLSRPFEAIREHRIVLPDDRFHLPGEEYSQRKRAEFETTLRQQKEEEERLRQFIAQPLPVEILEGPSHLPRREIQLTEPQPFHLHTDERGATYQHAFQEKVSKEMEEKENAARFKAHPLPDLSSKFEVKKSDRVLTEPEDIELHTMVRAEDRRVFDEELRKKEEEQEAERRRQAERLQREEEEGLKVVRQQLVHKAQPIRHYPPIAIKPSNKKLTEPESPNIGDKRRVVEGRISKKRVAAKSSSH